MYRVAIIDDEQHIRNSISKRINWDKIGLEVAGMAANGIEGLELIEKVRPHIVLVDIRMPMMGGLEMIKRCRELGYSQLQFVIISGYDDFAYAKQAIKLDVVDYIEKPIEESEIEAALYSIINKLPPTTELYKKEIESVQKLKKYILENLEKNITLTEMAEYCHLNSCYLSQLFKSKTGSTLTSYIENKRMEKAAELLLHTELAVVDISTICGYNDPNYFSKVFKKHMNVSPSQYGKKLDHDG